MIATLASRVCTIDAGTIGSVGCGAALAAVLDAAALGWALGDADLTGAYVGLCTSLLVACLVICGAFCVVERCVDTAAGADARFAGVLGRCAAALGGALAEDVAPAALGVALVPLGRGYFGASGSHCR